MPSHRAPRHPAFVRSLSLLTALPVACVLAAGTATAAPDLKKVQVAADGKPVKFKGAAVYSQGGSVLYLELSTEPLPCTVYQQHGRPIAENERWLTIKYRPLLQADGTTRWTTDHLEMMQQTPAFRADLSKLELLDYDPAKPVRFKFGQDVVLPESSFSDKPEVKLSLAGTGSADGCGKRLGSFEEAKARPQTGLKVTAAGRPFTIQGATYFETRDQLVLSTAPRTCEGSNGTDLLFEIPVKASYEGQRQVSASGDVVGEGFNRVAANLATADTAPAPGTEALFVEMVPAKAKGEPLTVKLNGTFMLRDVPVVLAGEVSAVDCDNLR